MILSMLQSTKKLKYWAYAHYIGRTETANELNPSVGYVPEGATRICHESAVDSGDIEVEPVSLGYVQDAERGCPRSRLAAGLRPNPALGSAE